MEKLSLKDKIQILVDFCESNNRLPRHKGTGHPESNLFNFMNRYKSINQTVINLRIQYRKNRTAEENYSELSEFCKINRRLPKKKGIGIEGKLHSFMNKHRYDNKICKLIARYRSRCHLSKEDIITWKEGLIEFEEFCKVNRRLPRSDRHKEELKLSNFKNRYKDKDEVKVIIEKYRFKSISKTYDESLNELKSFLESNKRLPNVNNTKEEARLHGFMRRFKYKDEIKILINKYRVYKTYEDNLNLLKEFMEVNKRMPKHNSFDKDEFRLRVFMNRHKDRIEIIELIKSYG